MPETVTQSQFYAEMNGLRELIDTRHRSQRDLIERISAHLEMKLDVHAKEDRKVEERVLIIETERQQESKQAVKHGAWAGIVAGGVITALIKAADYMIGRN